MKRVKHQFAWLIAAVLLPASAALGDADDAQRPAWNDINVIRENTEAPRAHFVPYRSREDAIAGDADANPWLQSLNGNWKFSYAASPVMGTRSM
jgi:hypothetical protein